MSPFNGVGYTEIAEKAQRTTEKKEEKREKKSRYTMPGKTEQDFRISYQ
jgi:hypothetical protein